MTEIDMVLVMMLKVLKINMMKNTVIQFVLKQVVYREYVLKRGVEVKFQVKDQTYMKREMDQNIQQTVEVDIG